MKIFFDTEFMEDGRTIELLSIGLVREDGATFYAENWEAQLSHANPWVVEHVFPHLQVEYEGPIPSPYGWLRIQPFVVDSPIMLREAIAARIVEFVGPAPEFWGYYADYDWVVLCQLFGTMMDLPAGWPKHCRDIKQLADMLGGFLPAQKTPEHHALNDAQWTADSYEYLHHVSHGFCDHVCGLQAAFR